MIHTAPLLYVQVLPRSFFVVLYIIYYLLNFIEICMHGSDDAKMDKECIRRQAEISRLEAKLNRLELEKLEDETGDGVESELLLSKLRGKVNKLSAETVEEMMNAITERYEVMAAVGYCSNDDKQFVPVKLYGIDEDITIASIELEDGLHAQAISDNKAMEITDIPADYIKVGSGSGNAKPLVLYILPIVNGDSGIVLEVAAFKKHDLVEVWNQLNEAQ